MRLIFSLFDCEPVAAVVVLSGMILRHSWDYDLFPRLMIKSRALSPSGASGQADKLGINLNRRSLRRGYPFSPTYLKSCHKMVWFWNNWKKFRGYDRISTTRESDFVLIFERPLMLFSFLVHQMPMGIILMRAM